MKASEVLVEAELPHSFTSVFLETVLGHSRGGVFRGEMKTIVLIRTLKISVTTTNKYTHILKHTMGPDVESSPNLWDDDGYVDLFISTIFKYPSIAYRSSFVLDTRSLYKNP